MSMSPAFDEMWADGSAVRRPYKNIKAWLDSEDRSSLSNHALIFLYGRRTAEPSAHISSKAGLIDICVNYGLKCQNKIIGSVAIAKIESKTFL